MLKPSLHGCCNQMQSPRWQERECILNLELIRLMGRFMPDFKTIPDFWRDIATIRHQ
jgi:hypothetical protein